MTSLLVGAIVAARFGVSDRRTRKNPNVTPTFDQVTTVNMGGSLVYGGTVNPGGLAGQIFIAVDRSGGPTNNNIYMMASVSPSGG